MEGGGGGGAIMGLLNLAITVLAVVSMWKIYAKAGKPGWAAIVPIYNIIVLLEIVEKPVWWIVLLLIPLVNLIVGIYLLVLLAAKFGKGVGFAILMFFFIGLPILAFSDAEYQG